MGQCYGKQPLIGGYSEETRSDADIQNLVDNNQQVTTNMTIVFLLCTCIEYK